VNYDFHTGNSKPLGLLAEKVTETLRLEDSDFDDSSVAVTGAPYLGAITTHRGSILQRIEIDQLLYGKVRELLCGEQIQVA
jgi:chemotaxis-related protein WspB